MRGRTISLSFMAALIALAALLPATALAAAKPAWKLALSSQPTNFSPAPGAEPEYFLHASNVGAAPATGTITIADTLPTGITPLEASVTRSDLKPNVTCDIADQAVTCDVPGPVGPGEHLATSIKVKVEPLAPASVLNEASIGGGGAETVTVANTTAITPLEAPFGFLPGEVGLSAPLTEEDGAAATQAGSHPYQLTIETGFARVRPGEWPTGAGGGVRDAFIDLPPGTIVNPAASQVLCTEVQLISSGPDACPAASQVGFVTVISTLANPAPKPQYAPLYNMVPPQGEVASFGFNVGGVGIFAHILGSVRSDGDFGLTGGSSDILSLGKFPVLDLRAELWGDPSGASHDRRRSICATTDSDTDACPIPPEESTGAGLVTAPTECSGQPTITGARADSWEDPGFFHKASYESADLAGNPVELGGCNALKFEPAITSKPTTNLAESPSGLEFNLHQPQDMDLESLSTAAVRDIATALPEGMTLNPSAADGIEGCSAEQIGMRTAVGESPARFDKALPSCPNASRLGTLEVTTPVLAQRDAKHKLELDPETGEPILDPLEGSIYLAKPFDNPFGSLLAIYLALEDQKTGIVAKVPAEISADPSTGQLVTSVTESPQLPLQDVSLRLFGGARAPLITPPVCGTHTTTSAITPWSSPEGLDSHPQDSFATTNSPSGGECATSLGAAPNNPAFTAGTIDPVAGAYSPFALKISREDGSQRLTGLQMTLPPGLIGKLAGIGKCSEAQIAQAKAREVVKQGAAEKASPSCPASSHVGEVDVSGGAGPTPIHVKGEAYMAGPYKGAPLSLVVITPAIAGPFDLGTVVTRAALDLDPASAKISAISDPFPSVLQGIPVVVRAASLKLDRPDFTLNPTSCDPMAITGLAPTLPGQLAALRSPFQVGGCAGLGFKPKLNLSLKGGTKRGGHPAFQAIYKPRPGDANVKGLVVRLPRSAFLDQAHIRTICTRVQFAAEACPKGAQYGYIKAWTPLLEEPLEGPVYLRSSDNKLPDLLFDLQGVVDVEVATRIDSVKGGIRASIENAPDAPLTKVVLNMQGQKKGLIINSRDICQGSNRASVELDGQNGKAHDTKPKLRAKCGKGRRRDGRRSHH